MITPDKAFNCIRKIFISTVLVSCINNVNAQCPAGTFNNTGFFPGFVTPTAPGIANENTAHAAWGGDYYLFDVTAGNTYVFRSCFPENSGINTVLSLYNSTGTTLLTFNDDFCGQQSQITWLATFTGQVRLSYYQSGCTTVFTDTKLGVYYTTPCTGPSFTTHPAAATTCNNYNSSFSVVASGSAPFTYQWQVNTGSGFTNISNGGVYSNATTSVLNVNGATTSINGYQYRCVVTNSCGTATSNAAALTVNATNNWTGAVSNNWHTPGNWSCGVVPGPADDVVVSAGNPTIAAGATGQCRNLSKSGFLSSISFNDATLQVYGNLNYTAGTITTNAGSSLHLMGSGQQLLTGSTPLAVSNLVVNNAAGVVTSKNIVLSGSLSFIAGHLYTQDNRVTAGSVTGASANAFVVTANSLNVPSAVGALSIPMNPGDTKTFPVGPASNSYNPADLQLVAGPAETFTIRMGNTAPPGASAAQSVQRTWHISENTNGGNTANITLQWNTSHEGGSFTRNFCSLVKSDGLAIVHDNSYSLQNGPATAAGINTYRKTTTGITGFSPWGVTSDIVVLPIILKSFSLFSLPQQKVKLSWELAAGSTPQRFFVYRSNNGVNFSLWRELTAITGELKYELTDEQPLLPNTYYRLGIKGHDGEYKLSQVLRYSNSSNTSYSAMLYPNPVVEIVQVQMMIPEDDKVNIMLVNSAGQQVHQKSYVLSKGSHTIALNLNGLAAGVYKMLIETRLGWHRVHTLIKQ